jgi:hypothetical protein
LSSVIQNGPSGQRRQDSPAQEWICQNGTIGRNHRVVDDEVIYSVNIATSKVLQINLEISVYKGKLYIFLKKSSWAEEEGGIWRPCRGNVLLDRYQDDPEALLQFALSAHQKE